MLFRSRDPEVADDRLALVKEDVLGLEVAMDNTVAVRIVERAGDGGRDVERLVDRELMLARELGAQRLPLGEGHYIVQNACRLS